MVIVVVIIMTIIVSVIMTPAPVVSTVFPANIMAVNPMMPKARRMAWHPHHFILAIPITRAMGVVWPVASFDYDAIRSNNGWKNDTCRNHNDKQKFVFDHYTALFVRAGLGTWVSPL